MRLTEAEGKSILKNAGIKVPEFFIVKKDDPVPDTLAYPVVVKAQSLAGGRGKAGLIKLAADRDEVEFAIKTIWKNQYQKRPFTEILIEHQVPSLREYYVSFTFDYIERQPLLMISKFGGMDIEVVAKRSPHGVTRQLVDPLTGLDGLDLIEVFNLAGIKTEVHEELSELIKKMYQIFIKNDCELVEINPLIETKGEDKELIAADCKIKIDDTALFRHEYSFPPRAGLRFLTKMEKKAREIDARSHRGVVGRTFLELDGDIAFMSSGGGASITCIDALMSYGGRPANFTEYSGNPEGQDVYELAKLILSKEGLKGMWIVGPTANFTDVYETLSGIIKAVKEAKPSFPIVIRRAGPRDDEAKEMIEQAIEETGLDITFFGEEMPMTESAIVLMDKVGTD